MAKSSIHIKPVKVNSENHNLRLKDYKHVRQDLTHLNFSRMIKEQPIREIRKELEILVKNKTGRKMQKKATPIREGVFLFTEKHTNKDIEKALEGIEQTFGIKPIQLHIHRDEGHYKKDKEGNKTDEWVPNLHAHVVFEWINRETGKAFKLKRDDMSKLQTHFATALGMERGQKSTKKHKNALEFKIEQHEKLKTELQKNKFDLNTEIQILQKNEFDLNMEIQILKNEKLTPKEKKELKAYRKLAEKHPKIKTAVNKIINSKNRRI